MNPTFRLVERFRSSNHMLVIPGRREAASPESITTGRGLWIPGSPPSVAPRNDQAAHMIGFIESFRQLSNRAFKADRNQLLGLDGEFHRQMLQHVAHKAVD